MHDHVCAWLPRLGASDICRHPACRSEGNAVGVIACAAVDGVANAAVFRGVELRALLYTAVSEASILSRGAHVFEALLKV
jgi:hypothetical protein